MPRYVVGVLTALMAVSIGTLAYSGIGSASVHSPRIVGLWDEHATQLKGAEKGLKEHFQVRFSSNGEFEQVSGTSGDATALGTWKREGDSFVARFDALNQDATQDIDRFHVVLTLTVTGNTFVGHGVSTGFSREGAVVAHGEALNRGIRISPGSVS